MQLTRLDHWLKETFVHQTKILTLRPPAEIPKGVREMPFPDQPGRRYKHLFVAKNSSSAEKLIAVLKAENQQYQTLVVDRKTWFASIIAPAGRSVTWWLVSTTGIAIAIVSAGIWVKRVLDDPQTRKSLVEAMELLRK